MSCLLEFVTTLNIILHMISDNAKPMSIRMRSRCQYYSAEPMSNLTTLKLSARVKVIWELMSWRKLKSNAKSMARYWAADAKRFWKFCTVKVCWVSKVVGYHAKPMSPMESAPKMLSQNVNENSITNGSRRMRSLWQDTAKLMSKLFWKFWETFCASMRTTMKPMWKGIWKFCRVKVGWVSKSCSKMLHTLNRVGGSLKRNTGYLEHVF